MLNQYFQFWIKTPLLVYFGHILGSFQEFFWLD